MVLRGESTLNNHFVQAICSMEQTAVAEEGQLVAGLRLWAQPHQGMHSPILLCEHPQLLAKAESWGWCECGSLRGCRRMELLWHKGEHG